MQSISTQRREFIARHYKMKRGIQARKIVLVAGQKTTVTEFTTNSDKSWSAVFFSNTEGLNSIKLFQKQLGGGYGTEGEIEYTIGNFPNGDSITGTGSCVISAQADNNCELSYYFVDETYSVQLPPLCRTFVVNSDPNYTTIGYPPFGRYYCTIQCTSNFDIRLVTSAGDLVLNRVVAGSFFFTNRSYFMHAPDLELQVRNSIPNQVIHIEHYQ